MTDAKTDAKRIIIVDLLRHGEPEGGDILRGRINPKLTPTGWRQMSTSAALTLDPNAAYAAELGLLAPVIPTPLTPRWTKVISSPLARCQHFAAQRMGSGGVRGKMLATCERRRNHFSPARR